MITETAEVDIEVFRRYSGLSLPRHVSYPMPSSWTDVDAAEARAMRADAGRDANGRGLSLYLHIPFCESLCKFCACNRIIQRHSDAGAEDNTQGYVGALEMEIRRLGRNMSDRRALRQVHWGGGTPTYLTAEQIERLHAAVAETFALSGEAEIAMEIDPRVTSPEMLQTLRRLGFNRLSMGVQDFDAQVQKHVRRIQPFEMVRDIVATCRELGFESINFDLIYGMPYQTPATIRDTIERAISLSPDRVAYYHYAQIPEKIATQRGMDYTRLPDSETKLEMFLDGLRLFREAGYEYVGLDHFAKPDEPLAVARRAGTLQRNFQGMTTGGGLDLLGAGVSSITHLLDVGFLQNVKEIDRYVASIAEGRDPAERGKRLTEDDRIRQAVINRLYCYGEVRPNDVEAAFGIDFETYFARERDALADLERDGLIVTEPDGVMRLCFPLGHVLMRNVAAVFDTYLNPEAFRVGERTSFSMNA